MEQREVERFRTYFGGRNYKIASRLHLGDERRQLRVIYQVYDLSNQVDDVTLKWGTKGRTDLQGKKETGILF